MIVGRGLTIGRPLAILLSLKGPNANAAVTVVHTGVTGFPAAVHAARPTSSWRPRAGPAILHARHGAGPGAVVVGGGRDDAGPATLLPDVDEACAEVAGWITPRVGGVGPTTIGPCCCATRSRRPNGGPRMTVTGRLRASALLCGAPARERRTLPGVRAVAGRRARSPRPASPRRRASGGAGVFVAVYAVTLVVGAARALGRPAGAAELRLSRAGSARHRAISPRGSAVRHHERYRRPVGDLVLLAELNVRHTRRHMPTRRVALDGAYLPTSGPAHGALARWRTVVDRASPRSTTSRRSCCRGCSTTRATASAFRASRCGTASRTTCTASTGRATACSAKTGTCRRRARRARRADAAGARRGHGRGDALHERARRRARRDPRAWSTGGGPGSPPASSCAGSSGMSAGCRRRSPGTRVEAGRPPEEDAVARASPSDQRWAMEVLGLRGGHGRRARRREPALPAPAARRAPRQRRRACRGGGTDRRADRGPHDPADRLRASAVPAAGD